MSTSDYLLPPNAPVIDRDRMPAVLQLFYAITPIQFLLIYIGATELTWGMLLATVLGMAGLLSLASSQVGLHLNQERPIVYAFMFLVVCAFGILLSPYGGDAKGLVNFFAMLAMIGTALVVVRQTSASYSLFQKLIYVSVVATGVGAMTGIIQSFIGNVLHAPGLFDLGPLSAIISGGTAWWKPATEEGVVRASGIYQEPSFLSGYLGITAGLALVRCGIGGRYLGSLKGLVPLWAAISILLCLLLTFSSVCYAALFATFLGVFLSRTKVAMRSLIWFPVLSAFVLLILTGIALQVGPGVLERFVGLTIFSQLGELDISALDNGDINFSVMVLFLNAQVAFHNLMTHPILGVGLGAHGTTYEQLLPSLANIRNSAAGLNSNDAAALFLRLISETGILGTFMFTAPFASAWLRVRRTIINIEKTRVTPEAASFIALAVGLNGALLGVFVAYFGHIPHYYDPQLWGLFALCVVIPVLAKHVAVGAVSPVPEEC